MKRTVFVLIGCLLFLPAIFSQPTQATLLGNWQNDNLVIVPWLNGRYNEVWGFAVNGHEFAVLGSTAGMHFIDVTEPANPQELFLVPGTSFGSILVHRDFKDFNGYLYCVADEGTTATLQIIDIQDLPNSVTQVYASNEFVVTSHNLFIDTSQARLYLLGAQGQTKVLDISNPVQPVLLGSYPSPNFYMPYVHDAYIRDNIGIFNCGFDGLWVVDFTNPASPVLLGTMTNYPGAGYNHSGWLSEDKKYYYLLDETHGSPVKVIDMTNFSDMKVVATMDAASAPSQIPHNALIRGNLLYVSYYYDGLQVYDISDPLHPQRVAYYDTFSGPDASFYAGAWGVNPLLPSGNILISDIQTGLWVFKAVPDATGLNLNLSSTQFNLCAGETLSFELIVGSGFSANGVILEATGSTNLGTITFAPNPAPPGSTVVVTLSGLGATQGNEEELTIQASDGTNSVATTIYLTVNETPAPALLSSPAPGAISVALNPTFEWEAVTSATSYKLQVSTKLTDFENGIIYSVTTAGSSFTLTTSLLEWEKYYWRVLALNDCGSTASGIQDFTTEGAEGVGSISGNTFSVFPNPAHEILIVSYRQPVLETLYATLTTPSGQQCLRQKILPGSNSTELNLVGLPPGVYILKITSSDEAMIWKVMVL